MRTLILDIETTPNLGYIWGLWKQNISISQLKDSTTLLCMAAKWYGDPEVLFFRGGELRAIHKLLSQAEAVVTFNGDGFDLPHLNREFLEHDFPPPRPFASIDLIRTMRRRFRFPSNKLDYLSQRLLDDSKVKHAGFELWLQCMAGDEEAWAEMRGYNIHDIELTEALYTRILPWINDHPSVPLRDGYAEGCPNCGSNSWQRRGYAMTRLGAYQQFRCNDCGHWYRGGQRVRAVEGR